MKSQRSAARPAAGRPHQTNSSRTWKGRGFDNNLISDLNNDIDRQQDRMNNAVMTFIKCMRWPLILAIFSLGLASAHAQQYELPADGSTIVGAPRLVTPDQRNTLLDITRHFDLGHHEITWANPQVATWLPQRTVLIPTEYILPPKPWTGIVINISQRRLFYFPTPAKGEPAK